jgi:hypothetical protein
MESEEARTRTRSVFESVSRCPNVRLCLETAQPHPCRTIVEYQRRERGVESYADFQVPEPWVGEIDAAPILFVASNPSIGDDDHASGATPDDEIWESHHLAHGGGRRQYILDGIRTVTPDGIPIKAVRYWSGALARARELIPDRPVVPGPLGQRNATKKSCVTCLSAKVRTASRSVVGSGMSMHPFYRR